MFPLHSVSSFSVKMCTLLNVEAELAHGKAFCINECALSQRGSSWFLLCRLTSVHLKCQCSQSSILGFFSLHIPSLFDFIKFWWGQIPHLFIWTRHLLNSRGTCPRSYLTGITNLCFLRTEPWSFLLDLLSPTHPGSSVWEIVQCNSMSCWFFSNHFSPSPSPALIHAPAVSFLGCSKSLVTALSKSSLPPSKVLEKSQSTNVIIYHHLL